MVVSSGHAANAITCVGEDEEQSTANDPNHQRETLHYLVQLLSMSGEQAVGDAVVGKRDGHENQHRHERVDEVGEPNLVQRQNEEYISSTDLKGLNNHTYN